MQVLITGGVGYIGSTIASACRAAGHDPVLLDDLSTGRLEFAEGFAFQQGDVGDRDVLRRVFADHPGIEAIVHCAARIVVSDSISDPLGYYRSNVTRTIDLLQHLIEDTEVRRLVFSSSASIYGSADTTVTEETPLQPQSPYARSKLMMEQVLLDVAAATSLRVLSLRYFNPVGADPALRTGQQLREPTNVMSMLLRAHARREPFTIAGDDWPTRDGTPLRDFIHVWDLARAHVAALERIDDATTGNAFQAINVGTGSGTTIRELLDLFVVTAGAELEVEVGPRRPGDVVGAYADVEKARRLLGWSAERSDRDGIVDALRWLEKRRSVLGF